jgi:hypothetical protein
VPWLGQCFTIQQVLLVEIDLREMLLAHLNLDPARRTGCIPAAIVIQAKSQLLGGIQQRDVLINLSASPVRVQKRHSWHDDVS